MKCAVLLVGLATLGFAATYQSPLRASDMLLVEERAYGLLPAEPIGRGLYFSVSWSPDGKFCLAGRTISARQGGQFTEGELVAYEIESGKTVSWKLPIDQMNAQELSSQWLGTSGKLALTLTSKERIVDPDQPQPYRERLMILDAKSGGSTEVFSQVTAEPVMVVMGSPTKPLALVLSSDFMNANKVGFAYRVVGAEGRISNELRSPQGGMPIGWTLGGNKILVARVEQAPGSSSRFRVNYTFDPTTGAVGREEAEYQPAPLEIDLRPGTGEAKSGELTKKLRPFWLAAAKGGKARLLVTADASEASLSPTASAVAYISNGFAMIRPIANVSKAYYVNSMLAEEKERIIRNAKQTGVAMMMYGADYDDVLPPGGSAVQDIVMPYLKNAETMQDFVYTYSGGALTEVKDPASTEIGYIPGPGGRAVIYADGHVKWIEDK